MKKTFVSVIVILLLSASYLVAQTVLNVDKNVSVLSRTVYLSVKCDGTKDITCCYHCPICDNLYFTEARQGYYVSGPASCGCNVPTPGVGDINP